MRKTVALIVAHLGIFVLGCSHAPKMKTENKANRISMNRPVIKTLDDADAELKKLQHSLVRLTVGTHYATGFFYQSKDLLITSNHIFPEKHECVVSHKCEIVLGIAKNAKELDEHKIEVEVVMRDADKDVVYLKVQDSSHLSQVVPIKSKAKNASGTLTAAGFYQDQPALTFSQGQRIESTNSQTLTNIIVSAGFSGSPIVNTDGELVGVVSSFRPIEGHKIGLAQFNENN
jgi:S1-C subfamily serine protease